MSIRRGFSFTLNTSADTFCTWLEDRSRGWRVEFTTDEGLALDLQKTRLKKHHSRTFCTFDVGKEIAPKTSFVVKGVIQLLVSPAPRAGQVDIRAVCRMEWAWVCFSYVLSQIAAAYPEADAKIREKEDKRVVLDLPDNSEPHVLTNKRKRGRPRNADYDDAYQNILNGMDMKAAFQKHTSEWHAVTPDDWNNFRRAMNRREKGET